MAHWQSIYHPIPTLDQKISFHSHVNPFDVQSPKAQPTLNGLIRLNDDLIGRINGRQRGRLNRGPHLLLSLTLRHLAYDLRPLLLDPLQPARLAWLARTPQHRYMRPRLQLPALHLLLQYGRPLLLDSLYELGPLLWVHLLQLLMRLLVKLYQVPRRHLWRPLTRRPLLAKLLLLLLLLALELKTVLLLLPLGVPLDDKALLVGIDQLLVRLLLELALPYHKLLCTLGHGLL